MQSTPFGTHTLNRPTPHPGRSLIVFVLTTIACWIAAAPRLMASSALPNGAAFGAIDNGTLVAVGGMGADGRASDQVCSASATAAAQPTTRSADASSPANAWSVSTVRLTRPLAFAAAAQTSDGFLLIGGIDETNVPTRTAYLVRGKSAPSLTLAPLADLPVALSRAAATTVGDTVIVVGGQLASGEFSNRAFSLDFATAGATWTELEPLPAVGRVGHVATSSFGMLHVMGGRVREVAADGTTTWRATNEVWTYRLRPIDGTAIRGWLARAALPKPLSNATATQTGQSHTLLLGGDTRLVVPANEPARNADEGIAIAYHAITDTWTPIASLASNEAARRAGAALLTVDGSLTSVGESIVPIVIPRSSHALNWIDYAAIGVYFVGMAGIGLYFARRNKSSDEFSLGNRNVVWWAGAMSMYATGVSSISLMAIPVLGFTANLVFLIPVFFMLPQAVIQAHLLVPLLRRLEITSTYEYLERRFNAPLRLLASGQCISLQAFGRMSVVLLLPSLALSATTGLNVYLSILLMGILTTIYTSVGGFEAVVWTDVVQGFIMFLGPIIMIVYALWGVPGGVSEMMTVGAQYAKFTPVLWTWDWTVMAIWIAVLAAILNVAGFAGDQPIVQRVYATPLRDVKRLQYTYAFLGVFVAVLVTSVGIALFFYYRANPGTLDITMSNDQVVPRFIIDVLPSGMAGIIIAAIFAAAMSTMSSSMNSVSVLVSEDFYRRFSKNADDRKRLRLMKTVSYFVGVIGIALALWMATFEVRSIFETWNRIVALLGGGFVGIYALGMFTTRANGIGAFCGAIASVLWTLAADRFSGMHWSLLAPSATLACIVVGYTISLFSGMPKRDLTGLTIFTMKSAPRPDALAQAERQAV
jgi:solute:Na+ symporter, SSS family